MSEPTINLSDSIQYVDLVIFCEKEINGYARELVDLIKDINRNFQARNGKMVLNLLGFVSKDRSLIGQTYSNIGVIGDLTFIDDYLAKSGGTPVNGIVGEEKLLQRTSLAKELVFRGGVSFPSIVHPTVVADQQTVKLGMGCVIMSAVSLSTGSEIGNFCILGHGTTVRSDCKVGPFANTLAHSILWHGAVLPEGAILAVNKVLFGDDNEL